MVNDLMADDLKATRIQLKKMVVPVTHIRLGELLIGHISLDDPRRLLTDVYDKYAEEHGI